jgi:hypothetical protein
MVVPGFVPIATDGVTLGVILIVTWSVADAVVVQGALLVIVTLITSPLFNDEVT